MQIGGRDGKKYDLGSYDDEADAARAFDRVASVLNRPLNFPNESAMEVVGPRSESADQAVTDAMEAAKILMDKQTAERAETAEVSVTRLRPRHRLTTYKPATLTIFK